MQVGKKYKVKKARTKKNVTFIGTCIGEEDRYYILQHRKGFKECFLKADLVVGEYVVREV